MSSIPCPVEGCTKDVLRGGFCYGHYMKNWRYGTPTPVHVQKLLDLTGQRVGELVVIRRLSGTQWLCQCDCGSESTVLTGDLTRGTAQSCGDRTTHRRRDDAGYDAAHGRVLRDRGPAKAFMCVDCGEPAAHWSYDHGDPNELVVPPLANRGGYKYSLNSEMYSPRCVPCHKAFDLARLPTLLSL